MRRTFLSLLLLASLPSASDAAPIYADLTLGHVDLVSAETFLVAAFWSPDPDLGSTVENPFNLGAPVFDGKAWRLSVDLPNFGCGTVQVDAWAHGGWFGEVRSNGLLCTAEPPTLRPPVDPPIEPPTPVSEPSTWLLVFFGFLVYRGLKGMNEWKRS